jgi:hypothetical protein
MWSTPRPGRFNSGKETRYTLYRRVGGPQGLSELCKIYGTSNNNFYYCLSSKLINKDSSISVSISISSSSSICLVLCL